MYEETKGVAEVRRSLRSASGTICSREIVLSPPTNWLVRPSVHLPEGAPRRGNGARCSCVVDHGPVDSDATSRTGQCQRSGLRAGGATPTLAVDVVVVEDIVVVLVDEVAAWQERSATPTLRWNVFQEKPGPANTLKQDGSNGDTNGWQRLHRLKFSVNREQCSVCRLT